MMLKITRFIAISLFTVLFAANWIAAQAQIVDTPELTLTTPNLNSSARYNADESRLLTWGQGGQDVSNLVAAAQVWDAQTGELLITLSQPGLSSLGGVDARWNADETKILTRAGFTANLWDAQTGALLHTFTHETAIYGAKLNADESRLVTWAYRGQMRVWDTATGDALLTMDHAPLESGNVEFNDVVWSPDQSQIYSVTWHGLYVWDAQTGDLLAQYPSESLITSAAWHEAAERWAYMTHTGEVYTWSPSAGDPTLLKPANEQASDPAYILNGDVAWNHDGTRFYTLFRNDPLLEPLVEIWDAESGDLLFSLNHDARARSAVWSPVNDTLIVFTGAIHLWDLSGQAAAETVIGTVDDNFYLGDWHDSGTMFAAAPFAGYPTFLFDAASAEEILEIPDESSPILWSPDGAHLLTSAFGGVVKIWPVG